jgi:hypothetical protein
LKTTPRKVPKSYTAVNNRQVDQSTCNKVGLG